MSGVLTSTLIILLLESFYVIWFMFPSFLDWCFKNVKCYFTCIYKIYVYTCTIVHPLYLLQCKGVYMDYCLSFVAITLVWYSHLFYVIIWYVFNHYVNGKEFSKFCMMYRFFSTPISPPPPTHTHSLHSTSSNSKGFWPVIHFTMLLHDCSFLSGHIRSHVCVGLWLCIRMMRILNLR